MKKFVIAVDFDGTIVESKWPHIGESLPNAINVIRMLHDKGHKIIIWTCRTGQPLESCQAWLKQHNIPYDALNENIPERVKAFKGDTRKISADIYIDDKALGMVIDWNRIFREVNRIANQ